MSQSIEPVNHPIEEWRLLRAKGVLYEVSNLGHVRRYIKPFKCIGSTYLQVYIPGRGNVLLHALVAELFLGPRDGRVVNHKDNNGLNADLNNLEYVTQGENLRHAINGGFRQYKVGERATNWLVSDNTAQEILDKYKAGGISQRALAKEYGLTDGCVRYIIAKRKGLKRV